MTSPAPKLARTLVVISKPKFPVLAVPHYLEKINSFSQKCTIRRVSGFAITIGMRQDVGLNRLKHTVPQWIGKEHFCALSGRSRRSIDYQMASGRLRYRKFPSGMVRFRASDANPKLDRTGIKQKYVNHFAITQDWITATALAAIHDVSVETVREWVTQGIIPHSRNATGAVSFSPEAVEEALTRFNVGVLGDIHSGDEGGPDEPR